MLLYIVLAQGTALGCRHVGALELEASPDLGKKLYAGAARSDPSITSSVATMLRLRIPDRHEDAADGPVSKVQRKPRAAPQQQAHQLGRRSDFAQTQMGTDPVSYTHLTLPTKA